LRFGLTINPPKVILEYVNPNTEQIRLRSLRLDNLHADQEPSAISSIVVDSLPRLSNGSREVCLQQVERLVQRLQKAIMQHAPDATQVDVDGLTRTRARSPTPEYEEELSEVPSVYEEDFELSDVSGIAAKNDESIHNNNSIQQEGTPVSTPAKRGVSWGNVDVDGTPVQVLEMSLTPNEIRRENTREPNYHPLDDEDWGTPDGNVVSWRLNPQDGWCYPIHPKDTDWLYNMASGVWFNTKTDAYCQGNTAEGFVFGRCEVDRTGQMYFLPDKKQDQAAAADSSSCYSASPSPSKQQQKQLGEQLVDEEVAECPSPANSPGEQLRMF